MDTSDFGARLRARSTELRALRSERGSTDPILIIAGIAITLVLLVGGSFAIAGFMSNARNLNAMSDLDRASVAQDAYLAANDTYGMYLNGPHAEGYRATLPDDHPARANSVQLTEGSGVSFTQSDGTDLIVFPHRLGSGEWAWTAFIHSESGEYFMRNSYSTETVKLGSSPAIAADWNGFNQPAAAAQATQETMAVSLNVLVGIVTGY